MNTTNVPDGSDGVDLRLDENQALVLFEWLTKFNDQERGELLGQAEQQVLFDLESQLESRLTAPFESNYQDLLERARKSVCAGEPRK